MKVFRDVINSKATLPLIWIKKNTPFSSLTCRDQDFFNTFLLLAYIGSTFGSLFK
jgi:hypothetical protein